MQNRKKEKDHLRNVFMVEDWNNISQNNHYQKLDIQWRSTSF